MNHEANPARSFWRLDCVACLVLPIIVLCLTAPSSATGASDPALFPADQYGSLHYYRFRQRDFIQRNPQLVPPDYYLSYGDRYIRRFTVRTRPLLSEPGQQWLDQTRVLLQVFLEDAIQADPAAFAVLETDSPAFRRFAFETHPDAYWEAGLADLPIRDLILIFLTPDVADLLSDEGRDQTREILLRLQVEWSARALEDPDFIPWKADELFDALDDPIVARIFVRRFFELLQYIEAQRFSLGEAYDALDEFFAPFDVFVDMSR